MLTLNETWTTIAEAYETKPEDRTEIQKSLTRLGICGAVDRLLKWGMIHYDVYRPIKTTAWDAALRANNDTYVYLAPTRTPEGDRIRAEFCKKQVK